MYHMLSINTSLLNVHFEGCNRREIDVLLERNYQAQCATRQAVLCLMACKQFRACEFKLGELNKSTFLNIAKFVWVSRGESVWIRAVV